MNHAELSDSVAASLGLNKADAKKGGRCRLRRNYRCRRQGRRSFGQRLRQVQGQGDAGPRRPQSLDRRNDPDQGSKEADLRSGQGRQGSPERLIAKSSCPVGIGRRDLATKLIFTGVPAVAPPNGWPHCPPCETRGLSRRQTARGPVCVGDARDRSEALPLQLSAGCAIRSLSPSGWRRGILYILAPACRPIERCIQSRWSIKESCVSRYDIA